MLTKKTTLSFIDQIPPISMHMEQCFTSSFSFGPVSELGWEDELICLCRKTYLKGVSKFRDALS